MKFTVSRPMQPRNPLVAQARFRQAGRHRTTAGAQRQQFQRELALELRRVGARQPAAEHAPPEPHSP